jgi:hypothetical protein
MANPEHLEILKRGLGAWNEWRREHQNVIPDLSSEDLSRANLAHANLAHANLHRADLSHANLSDANLSDAYLFYTDLSFANLLRADLSHADLSFADLRSADFSGADLSGAVLSGADLGTANLRLAKLRDANFSSASLYHTTFVNNDLSEVKGLEMAKHYGPSGIGVDTLYKSAGKIPEAFLRGCGTPESFIVQIPALVAALEPIQFYSCFISYSHKDEDFALRLYSRMRDTGLRVWYAPEEMKGGQKLHEQIFSAIRVHDKLLLVLSEHSLRSEWVVTEIRRARKAEREDNRRKLFPIRLVAFDTIQKWECFDAENGKDLGVELREYFIPDFTDWKEHDAFEKAFERLLSDLKTEGQSPV